MGAQGWQLKLEVSIGLVVNAYPGMNLFHCVTTASPCH